MNRIALKLLVGAALAAGAAAALAQALTSAEVRKVDTAGQKLTLKHAEIKNLDMPPMTMVFRVRDPAWLAGLKEGDRVMFAADKLDGQYTITELKKTP
jgi:Cu/Ag efflux protein CusF